MRNFVISSVLGLVTVTMICLAYGLDHRPIQESVMGPCLIQFEGKGNMPLVYYSSLRRSLNKSEIERLGGCVVLNFEEEKGFIYLPENKEFLLKGRHHETLYLI